MTGRLWWPTLLSLALLVIQAPSAALGSANTCDPQDPPWGKELTEPDEILPQNGVLDTTLVVRKKEICVPVWTSAVCKGTYTRCTEPGSSAAPCSAAAPCVNAKTCVGSGESCDEDGDCASGPQQCAGTWGWERPLLRTYGYPKDPKRSVKPSSPKEADSNLQWKLPGPTLRARAEILADPAEEKSASNKALTPGTRVRVALHNYLDPQDYNDRQTCDPAGPDTYPECFHGPEITNLHYHGSHVSPQPHQDYVLLSLWPYESKNVPTNREDTALGKYQTDINPLPWNQAPGTHWYHPHKHGSTALQVLNGMSGALLIDGPFDDWLNGFYGGQLVDRLLILQQVQAELDYFDRGLADNPPQVLVNGLATPKIPMRPGEIQRFRFVGATVQASAALEIGFDERIREVHQIAQDGVQFAWQNYDRQPYRDTEGTYSNFDLAPGNRADFLIKAPMLPGTYLIEHSVFAERLKEKVRELHRGNLPVAERVPDIAEMVQLQLAGRQIAPPPIDPSKGLPLLFTIEVGGEPKPMDFPVTRGTDPACAGASPPKRCWPKTPVYLEDLPKPDSRARELAFSIKGQAGEPPSFFINKTQYQHDCAGAAMTRTTTEDWQVANEKYTPGSDDSLQPHPFHIHINPFQVVRNADRTFEPPYVWQDTIALPVIDQIATEAVPDGQEPISNQEDAEKRCPGICEDNGPAVWTGKWTKENCECQQVTNRPAGPIWSNQDAQTKCPRACAAANATWNGNWQTTIQGKMSECGCEVRSDSVLLRQRFDDYTGAFVIHCHFLGHEDRGMMWNVETVCEPGKEPWVFGAPQANGGADNCAKTTQALKCCPDADGNLDCGPR